MSAIPPNVAASVLQSGAAQQVQSQQKDSEENARADGARKLAGGSSFDDVLEVEATDADTQVHTDSGGLGSQGRHDAKPEESEDEAQNANGGITVDENGRPHLDLSA